MHTEKESIRPITMPGVHSRIYPHIREVLNRMENPKILDAGAGHGAMSKRLFEDGYEVVACDMDPGNFKFQDVQCVRAEITKALPFADQEFDVVLLIEVMEHVNDHEVLFSECFRVLRNGGVLFFSTPNIVSLKSRMRFLLTGFHYAFKPLDYNRADGRQHVSGLTVDQYRYLGHCAGFSSANVSIDKNQRSSMWLLFLVPVIWLWCCIKGIPYATHNRRIHLAGRLLLVELEK